MQLRYLGTTKVYLQVHLRNELDASEGYQGNILTEQGVAFEGYSVFALSEKETWVLLEKSFEYLADNSGQSESKLLNSVLALVYGRVPEDVTWEVTSLPGNYRTMPGYHYTFVFTSPINLLTDCSSFLFDYSFDGDVSEFMLEKDGKHVAVSSLWKFYLDKIFLDIWDFPPDAVKISQNVGNPVIAQIRLIK